MPLSALDPATQASQPGASAGTNQFAEISSEEFVRIMTQELTSQDPFEPSDTTQILEQLGSLRNIESQMSLQEQIENLVMQHQVAQASALIGKHVSGLTEDNNRAEGVVTSVRISEGNALLELDTGRRVPMNQVDTIVNDNGEAVAN